jgi:hypothetical protein
LALERRSDSRITDVKTDVKKRIDEVEKSLKERIDNGFAHMQLLWKLHAAEHHRGSKE